MQQRIENDFTFSAGKSVPAPGQFGYRDKLDSRKGLRMPPTRISEITPNRDGSVNLLIHINLSSTHGREQFLNQPIILQITDRNILNNLPDLLSGRISCSEFITRVLPAEQIRVFRDTEKPIGEIRSTLSQNIHNLRRVTPERIPTLFRWRATEQLRDLLNLFPRDKKHCRQIVVEDTIRVVSETVDQELRARLAAAPAAAAAPLPGAAAAAAPPAAAPLPGAAAAAPLPLAAAGPGDAAGGNSPSRRGSILPDPSQVDRTRANVRAARAAVAETRGLQTPGASRRGSGRGSDFGAGGNDLSRQSTPSTDAPINTPSTDAPINTPSTDAPINGSTNASDDEDPGPGNSRISSV